MTLFLFDIRFLHSFWFLFFFSYLNVNLFWVVKFINILMSIHRFIEFISISTILEWGIRFGLTIIPAFSHYSIEGISILGCFFTFIDLVLYFKTSWYFWFNVVIPFWWKSYMLLLHSSLFDFIHWLLNNHWSFKVIILILCNTFLVSEWSHLFFVNLSLLVFIICFFSSI